MMNCEKWDSSRMSVGNFYKREICQEVRPFLYVVLS